MTDKPKIYFKFDNFELENKEYLIETKADIGFCRDKLRNLPVGSKSGRLPGIGLGFGFSQTVESMIYFIENQAKQVKITAPEGKYFNSNFELVNGRIHGPSDFTFYWTTVKDPSIESLVFQHVDIENDNPYIIAIAVQYAPSDWTGLDYQAKTIKNKKNVFDLLNHRYLEDLQKGKALLLIDQSVEGYNTHWLWTWFHGQCLKYKINPKNVIYVTGDQLSADSYDKWCEDHKPHDKLKIIPSISLSIFIHKHCLRYNLQFNFDELLKYKKENPDKIYLYDCLNRRARKQRVFNFIHLINANLLKDGNISMGPMHEWKEWIDIDNKEHVKELCKQNGLSEYAGQMAINACRSPDILPRTANHKYEHEINHYFSLVERVCDDLYKHSWVSLVVESSYYGYEQNIFISEKTFKPIAAMQPFIIVGSQHALKYLRKLGYKTFHPYIDESYDDLPDDQRYVAIMQSLKKIKAIEDKAAWYESIREIVEHNHRHFMNIGNERAIEHNEIMNYYFDYCKKYKDR